MASAHDSMSSSSRWVIVSCCILILFITPSTSQTGCGNSCKTLNDCPGQLICTSGKCTDDPDVGTHICSSTGGGSGTGTCKPGTPLQGMNPPSKDACNTDTGAECCTSSRRYTTYDCSPAISSRTPAILTLNDFTQGGDGGGPSSSASKCEWKHEWKWYIRWKKVKETVEKTRGICDVSF